MRRGARGRSRRIVLATPLIRRMNRGKTPRSAPGQGTIASGGGRRRRRFLLAVALPVCPGVVHARPVPWLAAPARPARRRRAPHAGRPVDQAAPAHARRGAGDGCRPRSPRPPAGERAPAPAGAHPQPVGQAARADPPARGLLDLRASRLRTRASALLVVRPETVLRWHRQGVRLFWRRTSAPRSRPSPLADATVDLIRQMARDKPLQGAERIRGELSKLDIRVSKRTVRKCLRQARPPQPTGARERGRGGRVGSGWPAARRLRLHNRAQTDRRHQPDRRPRAPTPARPGGPRRLTRRPAPQRGSASSVPGRSCPRGRPWLASRAFR